MTSFSKQGPLGESQFGSFDIAKEHIGRLVGSGGSVIRGVEEDSGGRIVIQNDGKVHLFAPSSAQFKIAESAIGAITGNAIKVLILQPLPCHCWALALSLLSSCSCEDAHLIHIWQR